MTFTPCALADAYEDFIKRGPQYLSVENRLRVSAYRFDTRVLIVCEDLQTNVTSLIHLNA